MTALILPQATDLLVADNHAFMHRVIAVDSTSPEQSLTINPDGSTNFQFEYISAVAGYAVKTTDGIVECISGTFTVTLPTAVGCDGKMYFVKNSSGGVITVATTGGQTIDGGVSAVLSTQYASLSVISNGSNWMVV